MSGEHEEYGRFKVPAPVAFDDADDTTGGLLLGRALLALEDARLASDDLRVLFVALFVIVVLGVVVLEHS